MDEDGVETGTLEVRRAHLGRGRRHLAFTTLIFDEDQRLLLARRAAQKMLWPGYWDATVASHPRRGEDVVAAGRRRLREELGLSLDNDLVDFGWFDYEVAFEDVGSENERCATLVGRMSNEAALTPEPNEIDALEWIDPRELLDERSSQRTCPWAYPALLRMARDSERARRAGLPDLSKDEQAFGRATEEALAPRAWRLL